MTETAPGEQGEKIHGYTDPHLNTPNSEHMTSIVPDSFEYSQCGDYKINQETLSSDIEAGRSSFNKEVCSQQLLAHDLSNGTSLCHASGLNFKDMSPRDLITSERSDDGCSDLKENPAHVGLGSVEMDLPTRDFTGGNVFMIYLT